MRNTQNGLMFFLLAIFVCYIFTMSTGCGGSPTPDSPDTGTDIIVQVDAGVPQQQTKLTVTTNSAGQGAEIWIDSKSTNKTMTSTSATMDDLLTGRHGIQLKKTGYVQDPSYGMDLVIEFDLPAEGGEVEVNLYLDMSGNWTRQEDGVSKKAQMWTAPVDILCPTTEVRFGPVPGFGTLCLEKDNRTVTQCTVETASDPACDGWVTGQISTNGTSFTITNTSSSGQVITRHCEKMP